ncbi:nuclear factor NF-kappa-B p105 subunit isoform X2 [Octopus bimaculoides]|uniref:RHD domain-containing protein n=1 Tax=Octopus bimaculoides TaxID=37653 RepID=A0A0L8H219_OCTBM|nr:nuclear factor NF-kappa-B p105 subunit isoform X2 [Octopus bimaculoides]|eukprot:XP_014776042.1 PREDICTED: nuclear factor NF-kappa-B p105 subunit-like isoform X2 [Octopus bimaculoides]
MDDYPSSRSDSEESIELTNEHAKQILSSITSENSTSLPQYNDVIKTSETTPKLVFLEQPQSRGFRFRYKCEGPSHGGLQGTHSQKSKRTYPTVQILNYKGPALFVVSLVTDDPEPYLHAHELVGKNCSKGICTIEVPSTNNPICKLQNIGVMHVTKRKVIDILKERILESMILKKRIDSGNVNDTSINADEIEIHAAEESARNQGKNMSLNVVRLNFQAYLYSKEDNKFSILLPSIVSNPVFDSKSLHAANLKIIRMDKYSGYCTGNEEVYLLCDRISRDDICVVFSENENSPDQWRALADFGATDIHKQYAIVFKTPPYHNIHISKPIQVNIRLEKPSNNETSEAMIFTYYPKCPDDNELNIKRSKTLVKINGQPTSSSDDDNSEETHSHENSLPVYFVNGDAERSGQQTNSQNNLTLNSVKDSDVQTHLEKHRECAEPINDERDETDAAGFESDSDSNYTNSTFDDEIDYEYMSEKSLQALRSFVKTGNSEELLFHHRESMSIPDDNGNNLLHLAVMNNQVDIVKKLLKVLVTTRYDIDCKNFNLQTCLHLAVLLNQKPIVRLLLHNGANQSLVDSSGNNPLHLAIIHNNTECLKELLWPLETEDWCYRISQCLKTCNSEGFKPFNLAFINGNTDAMNFLQQVEDSVSNERMELDISMKIMKNFQDAYLKTESKTVSSTQETILSQGDMHKMSEETRTELASMLDSEDLKMNWRDLALHLDLLYIIDEASHFDSPTKAILDIFESHGGYIQDVYEGLCSIGRLDTAALLLLDGTATLHGQ